MPLHKPIINEKHSKKTQLKKEDIITTAKLKIEPEYYNKDYAEFYVKSLAKLNLSIEQQCEFSMYIIKAIHNAKLHTPDILVFLWEKQRYYNTLINSFFELIRHNYLVHKKVKNMDSLDTYIVSTKNSIATTVKDYENAKSEVAKNYNFIDNGPYLTEKGIVFTKHN